VFCFPKSRINENGGKVGSNEQAGKISLTFKVRNAYFTEAFYLSDDFKKLLALAVASRSHPHNVRLQPIRTTFEDILLSQSEDKPKPNVVWVA